MEIYEDAFNDIFEHLNSKPKGIRFHKGKFNKYRVGLLRDHYPDTFDKWLHYYHLFSASEMLDSPNSVKYWKLTATRPKVSKAELGRQLEALRSTAV